MRHNVDPQKLLHDSGITRHGSQAQEANPATTYLQIYHHLDQQIGNKQNDESLDLADMMKLYFSGAITAAVCGLCWPVINASYAAFLLLGYIWNYADVSAVVISAFDLDNSNPNVRAVARTNIGVSGGLMGGSTTVALSLNIASRFFTSSATVATASAIATSTSMFSFSAAMAMGAAQSSIEANEARRASSDANYCCHMLLRNHKHALEQVENRASRLNIANQQISILNTKIYGLKEDNLLSPTRKAKLLYYELKLAAAQKIVDDHQDAQELTVAMYRYETQIKMTCDSNNKHKLKNEIIKSGLVAENEINHPITIDEIVKCEMYRAKQKNIFHEKTFDATVWSFAAIGTGLIAAGTFFPPLYIPGIFITAVAGVLKAGQLISKHFSEPKINNITKDMRLQAYQQVANTLISEGTTRTPTAAQIEERLIKDYCTRINRTGYEGNLSTSCINTALRNNPRDMAIDLECEHLYSQQNIATRNAKWATNCFKHGSLFSLSKKNTRTPDNPPLDCALTS